MLRFFHLLSEAGTKAPGWVRSEQQRERSTGREAAVERCHPLLLPSNPSLSRIKSPFVPGSVLGAVRPGTLR